MLADIVMLVRYALGESQALEPLSSLVAGRFNLWLGREEKAGRRIRPEDMTDAPKFSERGGYVRTKALFGARLPTLLDELTDALAA